MDFWVGGFVDPLVEAAFREARSPLVKAMREEIVSRGLGAGIDLWSVKPILASESLQTAEDCKYVARRKEFLSTYSLSPVEFLAETVHGRVRLLGGLFRRSARDARSLGVPGFDADEFIAAVDTAVERTLRGLPSEGSNRSPA